MEILNIEQNTDEWLEQRKSIIGGSDVPIIMGVSPYKTSYQLYLEKLGLSIPENKDFIFKKGHMLEDRARVIYELRYDIDVPPRSVKHGSFEFAQVSLDGLNIEHEKIVEFKYVGEKVFDQVKNDDFIPPQYVPQIQYQMFCTGYHDIDFVAYSSKRDEIAVVNVKADISYIAKVVAHCEVFYEQMKKKMPPDLTEQDYKNVAKATIRRTVEALRKTLQETYKGKTFFKWDGLYMEIRDGETTKSKKESSSKKENSK